MSEDVLVTREERGNISVLTMIYRPYNLLGPKLINALVEQIEAAQKAGHRAIVIRSGLRHFSAGADLDIFEKRVAAGEADQSKENRRLNGVEFLRFMELLPIPLIASVHGVCLGGGLELALSCDYIIAASSAKIGSVEATLGLHPLLGGIQRQVQRIGAARAKEMSMLARRYDAPTLEKWGLINLTVPEESLEKTTMAIAEEFAQGPTLGACRDQGACLISPSTRASPPLTRRWRGYRRRSGPRKISRPVSPRSARTGRVLPNSRGADMSGPLSGLRVVDFSRVLAGPLCARTLQDLGAEVIKIEPPSPDVSRFAFPSTDGMSGYYAQQNAGKRNVSINLNLPGAYELVLKLCDTADIVVENFRAGTLGFFGLDYETLSKRNPRLIYASITGYGQGGPWRSRMAYAPTVQAEAGFTENSVRHYGERADRTAHRQPVACRCLFGTAGGDRDPRGAATAARKPAGGNISTSRWPRPCSPSTSAPMSICRTTISAPSPRCLAPPTARSSPGRKASISRSRPASSAAGRFRPGCARCGAST